MSGETEQQVSGWTTDTLKEFFDRLMLEGDRRYQQRFEDSEKAVNAALTAAKEAVTKAEVAAEKRFDATNEFRGQLSDQAQTFMPRREAEQRLASNSEKIDGLASRLDRIEGKSGGVSASVGTLIGAAGVIVAVIAIVAVVLK